MPTPYAGANSFPANITIPSDGDAKPAATVNTALEGLADRTKYLKGHGVISIDHYTDSGLSFPTTSATFVDVTGFTLAVGGCEVGDILLITVSLAVSVNTASFLGALAIVVADGGDHVMHNIPFGRVFNVNDPDPPLTITAKYIVANAGTVSVRAQIKNDGTHISIAGAPNGITILRMRP